MFTRQTDRQTDAQTDRQTDRQTEIFINSKWPAATAVQQPLRAEEDIFLQIDPNGSPIFSPTFQKREFFSFFF